jgi:hypothetical protein
MSCMVCNVTKRVANFFDVGDWLSLGGDVNVDVVAGWRRVNVLLCEWKCDAFCATERMRVCANWVWSACAKSGTHDLRHRKCALIATRGDVTEFGNESRETRKFVDESAEGERRRRR